MKKIIEPSKDKAEKIITDAVKNKRNKEYKAILESKKDYIIQRYSDYESSKYKLEILPASSFKDSEKPALHTSFTTSFKKKMKEENLKKVYEELRKVCPYCGERSIDDLDHIVPKQLFTEFTLYPRNLLPSCGKCNDMKLSKFLDSAGKRQVINFYYDDIDTYEFLLIKLCYNIYDIENSIRAEYSLDLKNIVDLNLRKIVENHFKLLNLIDRYNEAAIIELQDLVATLQNQPNRKQEQLIISLHTIIAGSYKTRMDRYGKNDWYVLLYKEIYKSGFDKILIDYLKTD